MAHDAFGPTVLNADCRNRPPAGGHVLRCGIWGCGRRRGRGRTFRGAQFGSDVWHKNHLSTIKLREVPHRVITTCRRGRRKVPASRTSPSKGRLPGVVDPRPTAPLHQVAYARSGRQIRATPQRPGRTYSRHPLRYSRRSTAPTSTARTAPGLSPGAPTFPLMHITTPDTTVPAAANKPTPSLGTHPCPGPVHLPGGLQGSCSLITPAKTRQAVNR